MERKELGQIKSATFGMGGYQECMLGFWLTLGGESWGVTAGSGAWATERDEHTKWSEADRATAITKAAMELANTLRKAKKERVQDLVGVPVEVTFDGNMLKSWRVLTEVL